MISQSLLPELEHEYAGTQCLPLGDAIGRYFLHDAMRGVDLVFHYLAAPLQVLGVHEGLAEAGRSTEVGQKHGIAAVGEPLQQGKEAVLGALVTGATMDDDDGR